MTDINQNIGSDETQDSLHTIEKSSSIGKIIVEDTLTVSLTEDHHITAYIYKPSRNNISLGSYIQVPVVHPDLKSDENPELLSMVTNLEYIDKGYTDQYDDYHKDPTSENAERSFPMIAELEPISMITKKEDENGNYTPDIPKNISVPPKPSTQIYNSNDKEFLRTGLEIPEKGLTIGKLSLNGKELPSSKDPLFFSLENQGYSVENQNKRIGKEGDSVLWRHMLICGSTGTGKTHTCKNIIRQVSNSRKYEIESEQGSKKRVKPNMIVIDPESEYHQMAENPEDYSKNSKYYENLESKRVKTGKIDEIKNFYPEVNRSSSSSKGNISKKEIFSIPFEVVEDTPGLLIPFNAEGPTRDAIINVVNTFFNQSRSNNNFQFNRTYNGFVKWFNHKDNEFFRNNYNMSDQILDAVKRRIVGKDIFYDVFDATANNFSNVMNKMFKEGQVSVIPTGHLNSGEEKLIVMSIMTIITKNKIKNPEYAMEVDNIKELPMVLVIDEAHNYINTPQGYRESFIVDNFKDIAKRGRKYKLGLMMITQNPEDIQEDIYKQSNTKVYLGLDGEVLDRVNLGKEMKKRIQKFGKGQMMVDTSGMRPIEVKGFKKCLTKHKN